MTDGETRTNASSSTEVSDSEYLRQLGVEPRLKRALGFVTGSLFAIAFQGPTTGALLLTGATVALAGPAFIWAIPIIFLGQLLLAFLWAELSSHFPLTGGIYQWARRLGGNEAGWFTGLFYLVAIILVMPAVGSVVNIVLNGLFSSIHVSETNTVIISIITTVASGLLMATSVRVVGVINSIGVALELILLLVGAIVLLFHHHQNLSVLTKTGGSEGTGSYIVPSWSSSLWSPRSSSVSRPPGRSPKRPRTRASSRARPSSPGSVARRCSCSSSICACCWRSPTSRTP